MFEASVAALLTLSCIALLAFTGHWRAIAAEFTSWPRAAIAMVLLVAIIAGAVFYPALSSEQGGHVDFHDLALPDLFLGHALIVAFLVAWWVLRRPESLPRFLHLDRWVTRDIRDGLWLGAMGWVA